MICRCAYRAVSILALSIVAVAQEDRRRRDGTVPIPIMVQIAAKDSSRPLLSAAQKLVDAAASPRKTVR